MHKHGVAGATYRRFEVFSVLGFEFWKREAAALRHQLQNLQENHRSLWERESELSSEIDKLGSEVHKAEKSLEHAIPGDAQNYGWELNEKPNHKLLENKYDESKSQERIERKIRNAPEGQGTVRMLSPEEWEEIQEVRPRTPFESKLASPNARLRTYEPLCMMHLQEWKKASDTVPSNHFEYPTTTTTECTCPVPDGALRTRACSCALKHHGYLELLMVI